jgi:excinuclease ABC subunit C
MGLTHRLFGIRSCNEIITGRRDRPCLEYDIKRCIAPCVESVCPADEYAKAVGLTRLFLEGKNDELLKTMRTRMHEAAGDERFEEAAQLRDAIRTVQTLQDREQKMATTEFGHRDVFGLALGPAGAVVQVFHVRRGRVVERTELATEGTSAGRDAGEVMAAALQQFYESRDAPSDIHVPHEPDEREALETWLSERAGRRVRIGVPRRGDKRALIELAGRNAALGYQNRFVQAAASHAALDTLQAVLALPAAPRRIECFDISTIQGSDTVASLVVCDDGRMRPRDYRKFRIRSPAGATRFHDDFAAMAQVVARRYRALLEQGGPFPDLVIVDGGRGQLEAAYGALETLGLSNLVAVGLAKKEELLYTRHAAEPIALPATDPALLLLQRIRNEAHRYAVTFHRRARRMRDLGSELDHVPGIGPRRRRTLLTRFGSLGGVRRASREELVAAVGPRVADAVLAFFGARP